MPVSSWYEMARDKRRGLKLRRLKWSSGWLVKLAGLCFLAVVGGLMLLMAAAVYFARGLPSPDKVVRREGFATKIFDRSGKLLYDVFAKERRTPVDIGQVPR